MQGCNISLPLWGCLRVQPCPPLVLPVARHDTRPAFRQYSNLAGGDGLGAPPIFAPDAAHRPPRWRAPRCRPRPRPVAKAAIQGCPAFPRVGTDILGMIH